MGKDSPIIQCRKVLRGTGYIIKRMSSVAAHPKAPEVLHVMAATALKTPQPQHKHGSSQLLNASPVDKKASGNAREQLQSEVKYMKFNSGESLQDNDGLCNAPVKDALRNKVCSTAGHCQ